MPPSHAGKINNLKRLLIDDETKRSGSETTWAAVSCTGATETSSADDPCLSDDLISCPE